MLIFTQMTNYAPALHRYFQQAVEYTDKNKKNPIEKPDEMVYNTDTDRESACLTDDASESFLVKK